LCLTPPTLLGVPFRGFFPLPVGEKFTTSAVDRILQDTTGLLRSEGYFQATLSPQYENNEMTHLTSVIFKVMPGTRARVGKMLIQGGEQTFTQEELFAAFGLKAGDEFSRTKLDEGVSHIH